MSRLPASLPILILCSRFCFSADSSNNTVWKQIKYTGKHLELSTSTNVVSSPQECAEKSLCYPLCKSFGINTDDMRCSLYDGRVGAAGRNGTVESNWFYYWMLEASCPVEKGYILNPDETVCYKYYDQMKLNWTDAQAKCEKDGGHLFLVDKQDKRGVLNTLTIDVGVFLGATDEFEEGVWNWLNGEQINLSDFQSGEPFDLNGRQHCLLSQNGSFDTRSCLPRFNFLCEVPLYPHNYNI